MLPTLLALAAGFLGVAVTIYAALTSHPALMLGGALISAACLWPQGQQWRLVPVVTVLGSLCIAMVLPGAHLSPAELLGGLLGAVGLSILAIWQAGVGNEEVQVKRVLRALERGSEAIARARDAETLIGEGIDTLARLQIAPTLAFVAYARGNPQVVAAAGEFLPFKGKAILPGDNDSRSVQADHWVPGRAAELLARNPRRQVLHLPVMSRSVQQVGVLLLCRPDRAFDAEEISIIKAFARLIGSQLGQLHSMTELQESNELTLEALGAALEHRDDQTGGHTRRVTDLSINLGRRLGWSDDRMKALRWGAYLHDMGKIAVPDAILHKPARLTPEERLTMQQHTTLGYDMLQDLHFLPAETLDLVRYHHERWDGTGYPAGLRGQDIPDTARLFSIIDVFDALTAVRPYKGAWSRDRALTEIRQQSGRQFDPQMVEAFSAMMTEHDDASLVV